MHICYTLKIYFCKLLKLIMKKPELCIRNATVVLPDQLQETDVLVEDGIISATGRGLPDGKETLDAVSYTHLTLPTNSSV